MEFLNSDPYELPDSCWVLASAMHHQHHTWDDLALRPVAEVAEDWADDFSSAHDETSVVVQACAASR
eukprot:1965420-Karenia_brevis.AAC.1